MTSLGAPTVEIEWECFGCGATNEREVPLGTETVDCSFCGHTSEEWDVTETQRIDDPEAVLEALLEQTHGDASTVDGTIVLPTVRGVVVRAFPGGEGWWEATLEVRVFVDTDHEDVVFTAPLKQGPVWYADGGVVMQEVIDWLREITDSQPDVDIPAAPAVPDHDCNEHAVPYTNSGGALGHGWECGRCGAFLQAG